MPLWGSLSGVCTLSLSLLVLKFEQGAESKKGCVGRNLAALDAVPLILPAC